MSSAAITPLKRNREVGNLLKIAVLLDEEEAEMKEGKRRKFWVHPILQTRSKEGAYATLYPHLLVDEEKFICQLRMNISTFEKIFKKVETSLTKQNTKFRVAITPREKLVVCLRYLASGETFKSLSMTYRIGHSTVAGIIEEVCDSIIQNLLSEAMPKPTREAWSEVAAEFWRKWNYPNCVGALDGKHVVIQAPANSGSLYYNYKKTFSIVLMALVDANCKFIAVDVGSYGKNSDGGIFRNSTMGKALERGSLDLPPKNVLPGTEQLAPHVIVADEAFPLKTYLMRPFPGGQTVNDRAKRVYNYHHSRARRAAECAFGILGQMFNIYKGVGKCKPEKMTSIVLTTCILYNIIRSDDLPAQHNRGDNSGERNSLQNMHDRGRGGNAPREAIAVRNIYKDFFNSPEGSVPWQGEIVPR